MSENKLKWSGCIIDRMNDRAIVYQTRPKATWEEAQKAAETCARKNYQGDRYGIEITVVDGGVK
jgi:hypothetical protein